MEKKKKMKKKPYVIFIALLLLFIFAGCNNETPDPGLPDLSNITKITAFPNVELGTAGFNVIEGVVKDESHNLLTNIDLFFGEDNAFVKKTDTKGEFAFCFADPHNYEGAQQADYLALDSAIYDFKVIPTWITADPNSTTPSYIICLVIAATKDNEIDFNDLIIAPRNEDGYFTEIFFNIRFDEDGILLPAGYQDRNHVFEEGGESVNGNTALSGVEIFLNEGLQPVTISNEYGAGIEYLFVGDRLEFAKEGFTFHTASAGGGEAGEQLVVESLEGNTFQINGPVPPGFQIRGNCDGNIYILVGEQ